jgi:chaperonin cofactor prefoldin
MMAVQTQRANQLETQLKDQISAVSARNQQVARLNEMLNSANAVLNNFPGDAKSDTKIGDTPMNNAQNAQHNKLMELNSNLVNNGVTLTAAEGGTAGTVKWETIVDKNAPGFKQESWGYVRWGGGLVGSATTKGNVESLVQRIKSQIDSLTNTQQMDMLRLQSLNNKRNEAFDLMSNFVKKMQDSRSSILSNMR